MSRSAVLLQRCRTTHWAEASAAGETNTCLHWPGTEWLSHLQSGAFDVGETEKVGRKVDTEMLSVQQVIKNASLPEQCFGTAATRKETG